MKRMRTSAAVAAGVVASAVLVGAPVAAQDAGEGLELTISPSSGPVGTQITVSGADCIGGQAEFYLVDAAMENAFAGGEATPSPEGAWSGILTVEDGTPAGAYVVDAYCVYPDPETEDGLYELEDFEVTETTPPTVPPTTPPTTAPVVTPPTTAPAPAPAKPSNPTPAPAPAQPIVKEPGTLG